MSADATLDRSLRGFRAFASLAFCFAWIPVMYTAFTVDRGFTAGQYLQLWSIYYATMVVAEVPWGWAADRWGPRRLLIAGPLLLAISFAVLGHSTSYAFCVLGIVLTGAAHAMISGADSAYLYELLSERGRKANALTEESRTHLWRLLGVSLADSLGGRVASAYGTSASFDLSIVLVLAAAVFAVRLPRLTAARPRHGVSLRRGVLDGLARPGVLWIIGWYLAVFALLRFGFQLYQPTMIAGGEHDLARHGDMLGGLNLVAGLSALLVAPLHRRVGEVGAALFVMLLLTASFLGLSQLPGMLGLAPLFLLQQISFGVLQPLGRTALNHRVPREHRAALLSVQSMLGRLAIAAVLFLAGTPRVAGAELLGAPELEGLYLALGGAALVVGGLLFVLRRRVLESEESG